MFHCNVIYNIDNNNYSVYEFSYVKINAIYYMFKPPQCFIFDVDICLLGSNPGFVCLLHFQIKSARN